jgi:hypothetical protein
VSAPRARPVSLPLAPSAAVPKKRGRDWTDELRASVTTVDELARVLVLSEEELQGARRAEAMGLPLRITPYYLGLVDREDPRCPIRLQVVPRIEEGSESPGDLADPLGEEAHERRAAPRAALPRSRPPPRHRSLRRLLPLLHALAAWSGDGGGADLRCPSCLAPAFAYLEAHPEVRDRHRQRRRPAHDLHVAPRGVDRAHPRASRSVETIRLATRVIDAVRTPIGKYAGGLAAVRPDDLAALMIEALIRRVPALAPRVDQVVFGATNQAGEDNRNVARMAALLAGCPSRSPPSPSTASADRASRPWATPRG